jgi:tRNA pseudouridine55 synthase
MFGVLNLHKPSGMTSRDVVNRVQRLVKPAKCGHAGTLDPMATGVLLVAVGPATRLISLLQEGRKTYRAEFTLGQTSDTDDSTGQIRLHDSTPVTLNQILAALPRFLGRIQQTPPAFSAVHVDGQRAYAIARRGEEVILQPKEVEIRDIRVLDYCWPHLRLAIDCGSGTYIRSIARDLGQLLGCGALMSELVRTAVGPFTLQQAVLVDQLYAESIASLLTPAVSIVHHFPQLDCSPDQQRDIIAGRRIPLPAELQHVSANASVALTGCQGRDLLALAEVLPDGSLQPRHVFVTGPPSAL